MLKTAKTPKQDYRYGKLLSTDTEIIKRWKEQFAHLLNVHNDDSSGVVVYSSAELEVDFPTLQEIEIKRACLIQERYVAKKSQHCRANKAWPRYITRKNPIQYKSSIVHKNSRKDQCKTYSGESLLNAAYNVMSVTRIKKIFSIY